MKSRIIFLVVLFSVAVSILLVYLTYSKVGSVTFKEKRLCEAYKQAQKNNDWQLAKKIASQIYELPLEPVICSPHMQNIEEQLRKQAK